jgi:hypothetical protein
VILFNLQSLPEPPTGTKYLVLIANKHWNKVEAALAANPDDKLIVEGYTKLHAGFTGIIVMTENVKTVEQDKAKRAQRTTQPAAQPGQ